MQTRRLGKTDLELSVIGMGGIVVMREDQADADRLVAQAIDSGVTYFDVAPLYEDAQQRMGPALEPYRDAVALACKTMERSAQGARRELDDSLKKLRTDRFDIYQIHGVSSMDEARQALGPGGAIEAFVEAKRAGKVRYIGFSAHDQDAALHLVASGLFDSVLFPLNYVMIERGHFGPALLEAVSERGMGILALKAIARTNVPEGVDKPYDKCWYTPEDRPGIAHLMLRYTLNLPGVAAALPPGDPGLFKMAVGFADRLGPLTDAELGQLNDAVAEAEPLFSASEA
jgi:aryl-alcohol dehydrogenase-like predicted oxidoreductase